MLGAGALVPLTRLALWPEGRTPRRAALVRAHLADLDAFAASARRGSAMRALDALRARTASIETTLAGRGEDGERSADRLRERRVRLTEAVLSRERGCAPGFRARAG